MATNLTPEPSAQTIDLTGLPVSVVRDIRQLVDTLRAKLAVPTPRQQLGPTGQTAEPFPMFISNPRPTPEEFARLLKEMASGPPVPTLPPDWSRADIYDDHD